MSEKLRLQEPIRSPLETPRLITPLPYRSGTSFLAWAIVNNNQPVPDVFSKMTKIAASGRLGLIGYARVSTPDQQLSLQHDALQRAGCDRVFDDQASGARTDSPGLAEAPASLRAGHPLVVGTPTRLGRALTPLLAKGANQ